MFRTVFAIIGLVLAGGMFFFYTKPTYDTIQETSAKITEYNSELGQVAQMQKLAQDLNAQYNALNPTDLDHLQKLLPDHVDNIALILDLDKMASQYGMPLQNVDVSAPSATTGGTTQSTGAIDSASASRTYDSLTLKFSTAGTYANFSKLLADLEQSLRIVDLENLKITSAGATGGATPVYSYSISLRTYWLK